MVGVKREAKPADTGEQINEPQRRDRISQRRHLLSIHTDSGPAQTHISLMTFYPFIRSSVHTIYSVKRRPNLHFPASLRKVVGRSGESPHRYSERGDLQMRG